MKGIYLKVLFAFISLLVVSCSTRSTLEVDGLQTCGIRERWSQINPMGFYTREVL